MQPSSRRKSQLRRRPTARGGLLLLCGLGLFLLATHFSSNAIFMLAFFCCALPLAAPLAIWSTPARVSLQAQPATPNAAAEPVQIGFRLSPKRRSTAVLTVETALGVAVDSGTAQEWRLHIAQLARGIYNLGEVEIVAHDALGLFRVSRDLYPEEAVALPRIVIYPHPDWANPAQPVIDGTTGAKLTSSGEFAGLRPYRSGDIQRDVDWRASARAEELMVREYEQVEEDGASIFDWAEVSGAGVEPMLSRLAAGVLEAARNCAATGLRLPGLELEARRGPKHIDSLLQALAGHSDGPGTTGQL